MRFKTGLIIGAGIGYVLGAKAGRERYAQMRSAFDRVMSNDRVETMTAKGKAVVDLSAERARDAISNGLHGASQRLRDSVE